MNNGARIDRERGGSLAASNHYARLHGGNRCLVAGKRNRYPAGWCGRSQGDGARGLISANHVTRIERQGVLRHRHIGEASRKRAIKWITHIDNHPLQPLGVPHESITNIGALEEVAENAVGVRQTLGVGL